ETTCELPSCMDGRDNEGDGIADFPDDPGCMHAADNDEADDCPSGVECPACSNDVDDDNDGLIDYDGLDLGCTSASDDNEFDPCLPGLEVDVLVPGGVTGTTSGGSQLQGSCGGFFSPEHV